MPTSEPERVRIDELCIAGRHGQPLLDSATVHLGHGEIRGLIGHSGVGKTTLMRTVLGCLPPESKRTAGTVRVLDQDVLELPAADLQRFRRRHVAFVAQDPGACLNPTMRLGSLLKEVAPKGTAPDLRAVLDQVQLPPEFLRRRPGQLSGGQQRRVALARALVRGVDILLVDEPLAGLDGPVRRQIATVLRTLVETRGVSMIVTGHQVDLVRDLADDVTQIGDRPVTAAVAAPRNGVAPAKARAVDPAALVARGISVTSGETDILDDVELRVERGATTAVIGPSGAGKTTLARVLVGLQRHASGSLRLAETDVRIAAERRRRVDRGRVQYIPQNPLSTLNPKKTVGQTIGRPIRRRQRGLAAAAVEDQVRRLIKAMGLDDEFVDRYPHQLSGGQRQRVAIARALAAEPEVLVCDEITSALDRRTADAILDDLRSRVEELGLSVVLISHELTEVREHADYVYVVVGGRVVESGSTTRVFTNPSSQQTRELLS